MTTDCWAAEVFYQEIRVWQRNQAMEDQNNSSDLIISTTSTDMLYYDNETPSHPPYYFHAVRLSIFLITAVCLGLPCLIWAFYFVHLQRKTRGRISAFVILLLLSDLLQLLLYPFIVSALLSFHGFNMIFIMAVTFCLKICSVHLQQLVALEGVLTLKYPQISAHIFSSPCYIIISIIILLFSLMCVLLLGFGGPNGGSLGFGSVLAPVFLLVVTGMITYKAPPTPASTPATDNRPGSSLIHVTIFTVGVLYLPCVLVHCVKMLHVFQPVSWSVMSLCLLSLTVISEPLLCVLVCRETLSTQTKHTHTEFSSQQTAVWTHCHQLLWLQNMLININKCREPVAKNGDKWRVNGKKDRLQGLCTFAKKEKIKNGCYTPNLHLCLIAWMK